VHQFSIITPTFNRAKYLPRIYECLCKQDDIDFEWIIIDDGSIDNTKEIVSDFPKIFEIKYKYQENAGKPTAMNVGIGMTDSLITLVSLDSEDILCQNILKTAWGLFNSETGKFHHDSDCLSGLCQYENGDIIGEKFPYDYFVSDYIRYIKNMHIIGDKCVFYISKTLKKYSFPIFQNEKNIAPGILHTRIALDHKTLYVNQIFQEKQFLEGGLSTQNYWIMYPFGSELYYNETSVHPFRLSLQIKHSAEYIFFAKLNKKKYIYKNAKNKKVFPLAIFAYCGLCIKHFLKGFQLLRYINETLKKISKREPTKVIKQEQTDL